MNRNLTKVYLGYIYSKLYFLYVILIIFYLYVYYHIFHAYKLIMAYSHLQDVEYDLW